MKPVTILAVLACVIPAVIAGCSGEARFALNEPIRLGTTTLTVSRVEPVSFHGRHALAVFLQWTGLEHGRSDIIRPTERGIAKSLFIKFTLRGVSGRKYRSTPIPEYLYRYGTLYQSTTPTDWRSYEAWMQQRQYDSLSTPVDWVLLFEVPVEEQGVTLHLKNPFPEKGQPGKIAVDLKRRF